MQKIENFENVKEYGENTKLPAGPQCCRIIRVDDVSEKNYLHVEFDIVKGDFKDMGSNIYESTERWPNMFTLNRSYKDSALPFFKAFIVAVEKSNEGYKWDWNEKSLKGKYVIVNYREEETIYNNEVRTRVVPFEFRSIPAFKAGEVKVPAKKELTAEEKKSIEATVENPFIDDDLPF